EFGRGASTLVRPTRCALGRVQPLALPVAAERGDARLRDEDDVATAAAIPTVRSASRHELLAPERNRAVPALAGGHFDVDLVDHDLDCAQEWRSRASGPEDTGQEVCR